MVSARSGPGTHIEPYRPSATPSASAAPAASAETETRVQQAESEFATAQGGISDDTPMRQAAQQFNAAAVALEMAWLQLYFEAGCLTDPQQEKAATAVHDHTKALQQDLSDAGYYTGKVDGVYGPTTVAAVEALQKAHGLPVTGTLAVMLAPFGQAGHSFATDRDPIDLHGTFTGWFRCATCDERVAVAGDWCVDFDVIVNVTEDYRSYYDTPTNFGTHNRRCNWSHAVRASQTWSWRPRRQPPRSYGWTRCGCQPTTPRVGGFPDRPEDPAIHCGQLKRHRPLTEMLLYERLNGMAEACANRLEFLLSEGEPARRGHRHGRKDRDPGRRSR